jgi:hypothetical protein
MAYATDTFTGDGSTVEFTLTFGYIERDHVVVTRVDTATKVETALTVILTGTPTGDEYIWETSNKIKVGTAPPVGDQLVIQRETPENAQIVDWQDGSYIVATDLNTSDKQWLYGIQELQDQVAEIDGSVTGKAVKQVTGTSPVVVDNTDPQKPVVSIGVITKAEAQADPTNPAWDNDDKVGTVGAVDCIYKQIVGNGSGYPAYGGKGKLGQIRIDNTGSTPKMFYWDADAATPAWVEVQVQGTPGPPGTDATVDVDPNTVTGAPGSDASVVNTGTTSDAIFKFTIPRGDTGQQGQQGQQGPQGPPGPDGPPGAGVDYKGPIDPTQPNSEPANPSNGDFYVSTATGSTTWPGLGSVTDGTRIVYNAGTGQWDGFVPVGNVNLSYIAAANQGTIFNSTGTDAVIPLVDGTDAGLMSPGLKGELDTALQPGDNNSVLTNDAGYLLAGDNVSVLTNDAGYLKPGDNVSELNNDAGYVTLVQSQQDLQSVTNKGSTTTNDISVAKITATTFDLDSLPKLEDQ